MNCLKNLQILNFEKNEFNRLRFEWRNLKKEFNQISTIHRKASSLFYKEVMDVVKEFDLDDPFSQEESTEKKGKAKVFELDEIKKIYRSVAVKTHPDKNSSSDEAFKELVNSKKEGKVNKLLDSAKESNIKIEEISFEVVKRIETEVTELKKEIEDIELSIEWKWYHGNNNTQKQIIKTITDRLKHDKKKN